MHTRIDGYLFSLMVFFIHTYAFRVKQMYKEASIGGIISKVRVDQSLFFYVVLCRTMFVFMSIFE